MIEDLEPVGTSEAETEVSAIDANRISVTFDNEETVEIELEALVHGENEVTLSMKDKLLL